VQRLHGDVTDTHWRHSLMNWGQDPLKDGTWSIIGSNVYTVQ